MHNLIFYLYPKQHYMAIPKGNKLWKIQAEHSKDTLLASPRLLLESAFEYFAWCDKHPLSKSEAVKSGSECGRIIEIPLSRPYSVSGFCGYIGCSVSYLEQVRATADSEVNEAIERIEDIVRTQLFEGAAIGTFSTSIVSKWMGEPSVQTSDNESPEGSVLHIEVLDQKAKEQLLLLKDRLSA